MFTGIIQTLGRVRKLETLPLASSLGAAGIGSARLVIEAPFTSLTSGTNGLSLGESVAVNGVCLTVTEIEPATPVAIHFFVSPETMARTNLGKLAPESAINLERALLLTDRLSGHVVQGHVDGLAKLTAITPNSGAHALRFELPASLLRYCVEKGSVAIDGVSLTINAISEQTRTIEIMVIPHTWEHTRLGSMKLGEFANLEVDIFAKYVEALAAPYGSPRLRSGAQQQ